MNLAWELEGWKGHEELGQPSVAVAQQGNAGTRLSASKHGPAVTIPGRSRVRGHPYTPVEKRGEREGIHLDERRRSACRCKNRKANPGTRPTAYYFGHRNARAL